MDAFLIILMTCLLSILFLAKDVGAELVGTTTVSSQIPRSPSENVTSSPFRGYNQTIEGVVDRRTNESHSQTTTQMTTVRRTLNFSSAQNLSAKHFRLPTVPSRRDFNFTTPLETFLVELNPSEGDSITMSCIVYDPSILTVSWYKGERLSMHDHIWPLAPAADIQRMSISHNIADTSRRVFNLTIDNLHSGDSGEYTCRGRNRPDAAVSISVKVTYVPDLHYPECSLNGKRIAIVTEGDNLRFECQSEKGVPPWHLIWLRQQNKSIAVISTSIQDQSAIILSSHSLVASRDLNGATFLCSLVCLSSDCGTANARSCNIGPLIVNPRPSTEPPPIITINPSIQIALEGDDIEFSCSTSLIDGNAAWFPVDGVPGDDHIIVSDDGSQLAIKNVKENDTELMACGVFCEDKLITVGQVNIQVLHKEGTTTVKENTPAESTSSSTTIWTSIVTERSTYFFIEPDTLNQNNSQQSMLIGAPTGGIIIILLLVLITVIVVRLRKRSPYQQAATSEVPEPQLSV